MIAWKINRIPVKENNLQSEDNSIQLMRQILYLLQNNGTASPACLELTFMHTTGDEIEIYLFLKSTVLSTKEPDNRIAATIEQQLASCNYLFTRLDHNATNAVRYSIASAACADLCVVIKTEKIVTTPFMQEGYYYWADVLLADSSKPPHNFSLLFQALLQCDNSYVSFQLTPTGMEDYEKNVLQYLNMHLEQHMCTSAPNAYGMSTYEPYAQPAYEAYRHYVDSQGQPVFLYSIEVGSGSGNSGFVASQVIATVKTQASNSPELQAIPVQLSTQDYCNEGFTVHLIDLIRRRYSDNFIWGGAIAPPYALARLPFLVTADEALTYFRLPYDDGSIVGVKGTYYQASNELIDPVVLDPQNVQLGKSPGMINGRQIEMARTTIGIPTKCFAQHALIVGMPGTGKTTFCVNLLLQFHKKGIPFLAIEPTKAEYRGLIDAIPELQIFTPGNNSISPFILNPFIPPKGIRIEKYIPSLYLAFKAAFDMPSPLDVLFLKAIRTAYIRYGWRDYSQAGDPNVIPFGFHEFIMVFQQIIDEANYSKEVKGNLRSGGVLRLSNLIEQNRNIFDTVCTIPIEDLLNKPTVIELNAIDDVEQKALIIALLLINIAVYTKSMQTEETELSNVILLDEAHVLLDQKTGCTERQAGSQNYAVQLVENLIAEIRSYGTSIIIADQRPSAVGGPIVANTDVKVAFRLTSGREKDIICESMDLDENMRQQLSQLEKGQAYAFYHKLKKPQMVITPDIRSKEGIRIKVPDEEIQQRNRYWDKKQHLLKPYIQCRYCNCGDGCNFRLRADAVYFCNLMWDNKSRAIVDAESLCTHIYSIPSVLKRSLARYSPDDRVILTKCICIFLQRKAAMEKGIILDESKMKNALQKNLDEVICNVF